MPFGNTPLRACLKGGPGSKTHPAPLPAPPPPRSAFSLNPSRPNRHSDGQHPQGHRPGVGQRQGSGYNSGSGGSGGQDGSRHELTRAIEAIKARIPVEDVIRECIDGDFVSRSGRLWCNCPLHDEDTPSFCVTQHTGLWYCFGACGEGGDLIRFVQRRHNTSFWDSLEWLASRAGVELPSKGGRARGDDPALALMKKTEGFYRSVLAGSEGKAAREYLVERGISPGAIEAFGLGLSPASGNVLARRAQNSAGEDSHPMERWLATGLVRQSDDGRPYDFFRGRLMIPIRDDRGRTVGFGARRLEDPRPETAGSQRVGESGKSSAKSAGPKYVNTPETPWFHKGRLIYGYDRAADAVRRGGHMILMEGYTDVIAAHQAGVAHAGAVLGTATTSDHARLIRRAGARRVTLVFDGDEAGRKAAWKAIVGLLPLEIDLDVAVPPAGKDPADLVSGGNPAPLMALLEQADPWLDFAVQSLEGLKGRPLSQGVDRILELFGYIPKPVHADACLQELALATGIPRESLRAQWEQLPERLRARRGEAQPQGPGGRERQPQEPHRGQSPGKRPDQAGEGVSDSQQSENIPSKPVDPRVERAYRGVIGAALCDTSLIPRVGTLADSCEVPGAKALLVTMLELWESDDPDAPDEITVAHIMNALADHPVRDRIVSLQHYAEQAEDLNQLLESELEFLTLHAFRSQRLRVQARIQELAGQVEYDPAAGVELQQRMQELNQLNLQARALEAEDAEAKASPGVIPSGTSPDSEPPNAPDGDPRGGSPDGSPGGPHETPRTPENSFG